MRYIIIIQISLSVAKQISIVHWNFPGSNFLVIYRKPSFRRRFDAAQWSLWTWDSCRIMFSMYILFVKSYSLHAREKMKIYQTGIPVFWEIKTQIKLVTPNPVASEESNYANPGFALSAFQPPLTLHINLVIPHHSHLWGWGDKCRLREMKRLLSLFPVFLCSQRCSARDPLSKDVPVENLFLSPFTISQQLLFSSFFSS